MFWLLLCGREPSRRLCSSVKTHGGDYERRRSLWIWKAYFSPTWRWGRIKSAITPSGHKDEQRAVYCFASVTKKPHVHEPMNISLGSWNIEKWELGERHVGSEISLNALTSRVPVANPRGQTRPSRGGLRSFSRPSRGTCRFRPKLVSGVLGSDCDHLRSSGRLPAASPQPR